MTSVDDRAFEDGDEMEDDGGFGVVPVSLMRHGELTVYEIGVLAVLSGRYGPYGTRCPSMQTIAFEAGCGVRAAERALTGLEDKNIISSMGLYKDQDGNVATHYRMTWG